jgi:hypothetical protein
MDYCSSCRRHLNGALVCPGCGAYAPDIAPAVADVAIGVVPAAMTSWGAGAASESSAWNAWHDGRAGDETAVGAGGTESTAPGDASVDLDGVAALPEGRAARRRQRARWKRNQRRAVVATAVALVGGGLTLASMDRQSGDRTQAAAAPKDPGMGTLEEQTLRDAHPTSPQPDGQRSSPSPAAQPSAPGLKRGQYATDSLRTTPSARPDAAAAPRTAAGSNPQSKSTTQSSGTTGTTGTTASDRTDPANTTVTQPTQTPAPAPTGGTSGSGDNGGTGGTSGNSGTGGTSSGTSQTSTSPTTTSPTQICLLVVCIG